MGGIPLYGIRACTKVRNDKVQLSKVVHELFLINLGMTIFNASCGMQLDCENEWFKRASQLPWKAWEALYAALFPSDIGNIAKPCRMVLGSLIIQLRMGFSDRDLVRQIQENPYYQYFIGLEAFQHVPPFAPILLVEWRKRIEVGFVIKANDALCK